MNSCVFLSRSLGATCLLCINGVAQTERWQFYDFLNNAKFTSVRCAAYYALICKYRKSSFTYTLTVLKPGNIEQSTTRDRSMSAVC